MTSSNPLQLAKQHKSKLISSLQPRTKAGCLQSTLNNSLSKPAAIRERSKKPLSPYQRHQAHVFNALKYLQTFPAANPAVIAEKSVNLPRKKGSERRKTVVFDLDETLVHCVHNNFGKADVILKLALPKRVNFGIRIRPFALEVLQAASAQFEVVVFTASQKCYADPILDYLDPTGDLIQHRLYRESCVAVDGSYTKDLRIFSGRDLKDVLLVDNSVLSFGYQLDNGVPIISWYGDSKDRELQGLIGYLNAAALCKDVRELNKRTFRLSQFSAQHLS